MGGWRGRQEPKPATVPLVAGQQQQVLLSTGMQNRRIIVEVTGTLTVTGADAASTAINGGSILAAVIASIVESGRQTWQNIDLRSLRFLTGVQSPQTLQDAVRLTTAQAQAAAAYNLRETAIFNFGNPFGVSERETFYLEANAAQTFAVELTLVQNALATIWQANGGAGTATLTNVVVNVIQDYSLNEPSYPVFKPTARHIVQNVAGANTQLPILLQTTERLRGIVVQQDTNLGEVTDIINAFALRGDNVDIIGPNQMNAARYVRFENAKYAGIDVVNRGAYFFLDFCPDGRISSFLYPSQQANNLRLELNCQPSVVAGVTNSIVRVMLLEMTRPMPSAGKVMVQDPPPSFALVG